MLQNVFRAEVATAAQLESALSDNDFQYIYASIRLLSESTADKFRVIIVPPVFLGDCEVKVKNKLAQLRTVGFESLLCHTIGHIHLGKELGFKLHGGYRLNITNSGSAAFFEAEGLKDMTFSPELSLSFAKEISHTIPVGLIAYGKLPLMITRRCPIKDGKPCNDGKNCGKFITDRKGERLDILCDNTIELLNSDVMVLSDKLSDFEKFDFLTLKFTVETDINGISELYKTGGKYGGRLTRGLYYRGLEN